MDTTLNDILIQCKKAASRGSRLATTHRKNLGTLLENASNSLSETIADLERSSNHSENVTAILRQHLDGIKDELRYLSDGIDADLNALKKRQSSFSVTLFGRTMTGKSTLMEIFTNGNGETIGKGAQRTTQDVRQYDCKDWAGLRITDVPGIAAYGGERDNELAFEAAKTADMILFLFSDDGPQESEAEWFAQVVGLGKPVVCVMNVKEAIDTTLPAELLEEIIAPKFDQSRLNDIQRQFCKYGNKYGQDWGNIPFVQVHLQAAFLANRDEARRDFYRKLSRIDYLYGAIVSRVKERGPFYRIKNYITTVSRPVHTAFTDLLALSKTSRDSAQITLENRRELYRWRNNFSTNATLRINAFIKKQKNDLKSVIAAFAEDYFDNPDLQEEWDKRYQRFNLVGKCTHLMQEIDDDLKKKLSETARELNYKLGSLHGKNSFDSLKTARIRDIKRGVHYTARSISTDLFLGSLVTAVVFQPLSAPFGIASIVVGAVGEFISWLFDDRETKEKNARTELQNQLIEQTDGILLKLQEQMEDQLSKLTQNADAVLQELSRTVDVLFRLSDTQRELAKNLRYELLDLNDTLMLESLRALGAEKADEKIQAVARVAGDCLLLMLEDDAFIQPALRRKLEMLHDEKVFFIKDPPTYEIMIARILGDTVSHKYAKLDTKHDIIHLDCSELSPQAMIRLQLAQQFCPYQIILKGAPKDV